MKLYLRLEAPYEWVRLNGHQVEAFGEVPSLVDYPVNEDDDVIGIVPGEWVTVHRVSLPAKSRKQFNLALPYALEESISEEVDQMHFVCPDWRAGEDNIVFAAAKVKMLQWQDAATDARLPITQLLPDHAVIPFHESADCSLVKDHHGSLLLRQRDQHSAKVDAEFLDVCLMEVPVANTIAVNDEALTEALIAEHQERDIRHWSCGNKLAHWLEYAQESKLNLWGEQYRPKVARHGKRLFLIPLLLIAAAIFIKLAFDSYRYFAMHAEIASILEQQQQILNKHFPELQGVQAGNERPLMERAIKNMSAPVQEKGLHHTLADVARILRSQNVTLSEINFRNQELILTCLLNDFSQVDVLASQIGRIPELTAQLQNSESEDGQIIATYKIVRRL